MSLSESTIGKMVKVKVGFSHLFIPALALVIALFSVFCGHVYADDLKWSPVNLPKEGQAGHWVLADGSNVRYLTQASDGTLYSYSDPTGTPYRLFKSADGGQSWESTGKLEDVLIDITIIPGKPEFVYCATTSKIYKSADAGRSFNVVAINPAGAGLNGIEITSVDVSSVEGSNWVAFGTRDIDNSQYGGVYTFDEKNFFTFNNTEIGNYDIYKVAFSPHFSIDRQIVAVASDEYDTVVTTNIMNRGWNRLVGDARIKGLNPVSAEIAFPADYDLSFDPYRCVQYVAINSGIGEGDVYRVEGEPFPSPSRMVDLNVASPSQLDNLDVISLSVNGNTAEASILAGSANSAQVYFSSDAGLNWTASTGPPTGDSRTYVQLAPDFSSSGTAYTATSGIESAFSISRDRAVTWNPISLIDTRIVHIYDLAVSPAYSQNNTLFILTGDVKQSLWRSTNGGANWERLFSSSFFKADRLDRIAVPPHSGKDNLIFLSGISNGHQVVWRSINNGQNFQMVPSIDPLNGIYVNITSWVVGPNDNLYVGAYDGNKGAIYELAGNKYFYEKKGIAGNQSLNCIALSPDYVADKTILASNPSGWIYLSQDGGLNFNPLPATPIPVLSGTLSLVFDPDYSRNRIVYAASNTPGKGIYRFRIGKSQTWEAINGTLPGEARVGQVVSSLNGCLYAVYSQLVGTINKNGLVRSLNPSSGQVSFETDSGGLSDGMVLTKLWINGNRIWTIDNNNSQILTYTDTATDAINLNAPKDNSPGLNPRQVTLDWNSLKGVTRYCWEVSTDTGFPDLKEGFKGSSQSTTVKLSSLDSDSKYYWRVKAESPLSSPWSDAWSFCTLLTADLIAPKLDVPAAAAVEVPLMPVFQWSAFAGADRYELLISTNNSFKDIVVERTGNSGISSTAWKCDVPLEYSTTYYWKIRAININSYSAWSSVNAFTTLILPSFSASPTPSPVSLSTSIILPQPTITVVSSPIYLPTPTYTVVTSGSNMNLIYVLSGGLILLSSVIIIVVICMLRIFKTKR